MPSVESLTFDLAGCKLVQRIESERLWMSPERVAHRLRFYSGAIRWPFDLTDPDAARAYYARQCEQNAGVMMQMDVVTVAGAEALWGLFKYRIPQPGSLGMYYVGILWLPLADCRFQLNIEAAETGTTGLREAAVMVAEPDGWPMEQQAEIPIVRNDEDLRALYEKARVRRLPSDDRRFDASFPQHPLSLVRARLAHAIATARLEADARGS